MPKVTSRGLSALTALALVLPLAGQSGAIYTTDKFGDQVNGNVYNRDRDVYLTGGPGANGSCSSPGLPNGDYYFQVTDPSGAVLLTQDSIEERRVRVEGGVVSQYLGETRSTSNRTGPCGALLLQLVPFDPTTSSGGEYKVWMTPVERYDWGLSGFHGFLSKFSNTDNFKIKDGRPIAQSEITGFKFYDHSEDGIWNPGLDPLELPIAGWRIEIYLNGNLDGVTYTDMSGKYTFLRDQGNTYIIREVAPGGFIGDGIPGAVWLAITPRQGQVTTDAETVRGPDFGNLRFEVKVGVGRTKGFWHNQNGRDLLALCDDPNEPNWRDALTTRTFPGGTTPVHLRRNLSLPPAPGPSPNPATIFAPLSFASGATFAEAHDDFSNWIVGDPALGHAAFILSTHVAATILGRECGFMQFTVYVDRFQNGILVSLEDMLEGVTGVLCDPYASLTGPNDNPNNDPHITWLRNTILSCINEFSSITQTGDPNEPQVVSGPAGDSGEIDSPY